MREMAELWFEPTDLKKAIKPFTTDLWKTLSFISPNFNELRTIANAIGFCTSIPDTSLNQLGCDEVLDETSSLARRLLEHIGMVLVTLGHLGVMVVRRGNAEDAVFCDGKLLCARGSSAISARLYRAPQVKRMVNVSGAGDCFAAGFIAAMLRGLPESSCASVGTASAALALQASSAVPEELLGQHGAAWRQAATYEQVA